MSKSVTPTDWELYLLHILWEHGACSVDEVREILRKRGLKRSESALRTILKNMRDKELLNSELDNRITKFSANVKRPSLEKKCVKHMVNTLFKGSHEDFVLRVLDETKITDDVVKKMKEKISEYKKNN